MSQGHLSTDALLILAYLCDGQRAAPRLTFATWEARRSLVAGLGEIIKLEEIDRATKRLSSLGYVEIWPTGDRVRITLEGIHFVLTNHEFIAARLERSRRCPKLLKMSVREISSYLGFGISDDDIEIPAAGRFVKVSDNQDAFDNVIKSLDHVKAEFAKDHNKNQMPTELKKQAEAEIDGFLAQIRKGFVNKVGARSLVATLKSIEQVALRVAIAATAVGIAIAAIRKAVGI